MTVPLVVPLTMAGVTGATMLAKAIGDKWKADRELKSITPSATETKTQTITPTITPTPTIKNSILETPDQNTLTQTTSNSLIDSIKSTPQPTPTLNPELTKTYGENIPYMDSIKKYYPGDENRAANVFKNESGLQANKFHINGKWQTGIVVKPEEVEATKKLHPDWMVISNIDEWKQLRQQYPSIDVSVTQLNTADAMNDYMAKQGLTYWDLMTAPDGGDKALKIGSDLLYGKIPYTAPGWQNWVAYNNMDEKDK